MASDQNNLTQAAGSGKKSVPRRSGWAYLGTAGWIYASNLKKHTCYAAPERLSTNTTLEATCDKPLERLHAEQPEGLHGGPTTAPFLFLDYAAFFVLGFLRTYRTN